MTEELTRNPLRSNLATSWQTGPGLSTSESIEEPGGDPRLGRLPSERSRSEAVLKATTPAGHLGGEDQGDPSRPQPRENLDKFLDQMVGRLSGLGTESGHRRRRALLAVTMILLLVLGGSATACWYYDLPIWETLQSTLNW